MPERTNPHEARARDRKAYRLLAVLDDAVFGQISPETVKALSEADWRRAAVVAGCPLPSPTTRELVASLAAERMTRRSYLTRSR